MYITKYGCVFLKLGESTCNMIIRQCWLYIAVLLCSVRTITDNETLDLRSKKHDLLCSVRTITDNETLYLRSKKHDHTSMLVTRLYCCSHSRGARARAGWTVQM